MKVVNLLGTEQQLAGMVDKKFRNGLVAFRFYKVLKQYEEELKKFRGLQQELLKDWVGKEITEEMVKSNPELQEIERRLQEASQEELPPPMYTFRMEDFEGVELSVQQVAALVELGIVKEGGDAVKEG